MLSVFPVLIGIAVVFGRLIRRNSKEAQDRLADSNVIVEETLQGIASVKAFANEDYEKDRYRRALDHFLGRVLRGASTAAASSRSSSSPCSARWCWCCGTASAWCRPAR